MNDSLDLAALKDAWRALDRKLERQHALELHLFRQSRLRRARLHLFPYYFEAVLEILVGLTIAVLAGSFWTGHLAEPIALIAGLALHAYGVALIGLATYQLVLLAHLDFSAPVLAIQKSLAGLQEQRTRAALALGLPWWILWLALLVCLARAFPGIDLYARAPAWVLGNLAVGLTGLIGSFFAIRWLRRRNPASVTDVTALGWLLVRARRNLEEIERFEREG
ncbi:MAG: serine/threonine protein kinase [Planctomycetota bacterium]